MLRIVPNLDETGAFIQCDRATVMRKDVQAYAWETVLARPINERGEKQLADAATSIFLVNEHPQDMPEFGNGIHVPESDDATICLGNQHRPRGVINPGPPSRCKELPIKARLGLNPEPLGSNRVGNRERSLDIVALHPSHSS